MSAKKSDVTEYVQGLMQKQEEPKEMKWIVRKACLKFLGRYERGENQKFHRQVWNACYNSIAAGLMKRTVKQGTSYFQWSLK